MATDYAKYTVAAWYLQYPGQTLISYLMHDIQQSSTFLEVARWNWLVWKLGLNSYSENT